MRYGKMRLTVAMCCLALVWAGCESLLEPDPSSFTTTANYYQSPRHFEAGLNSAYAALRDQAGISTTHFRWLTEIRMDTEVRDSDRPTYSVAGQPLRDWFAVPSNPFFYDAWSDPYYTIAQTNVILGRIGDVGFNDETQRNRIIGQARFIRALSYWYLVQFFGDVPLVLQEVRTPGEAIPEGRRPAADVYEQIISDLQDAVEKLPPSWSEPGRATEGAAKFLLGRTYLLTEDYASAVAEFEDLVASEGAAPYGYRLLTNYRDVFDPSNTNNAESIFELQFGANQAGQPDMGLISDILPWGSRGEIVSESVNPQGFYLPSSTLIDMYEDGDEREEATIRWWEDEDGPIALFDKFLWPEHINAQGEQSGNDILFRYADVLLSLAEAYWRLGNDAQAVSNLNRVRARAGLPGVDETNVPMSPLLAGTYLEGDPVGRAIFNERTIELVGEGHRMFDLMRFGVAHEVMSTFLEIRKEQDPTLSDSYTVEAHEILLPINPEEIALSEGALTQTPGW